jgi:hypothetical protein
MTRSLLGRVLMAILATTAIEFHPCQAAPEFSPKSSPSKAEWQHFHKMTETQLMKLWTYESQRGHKALGDWSWEWRMGWLQRCASHSLPDLCSVLLFSGLKDEAMAVRAEAATQIGRRFEGKPSNKLTAELSKAYIDVRNSRHGNPLFVCDRILEAMERIGGANMQKTAAVLALQHPQTQSYWSKINGKNKPQKSTVK